MNATRETVLPATTPVGRWGGRPVVRAAALAATAMFAGGELLTQTVIVPFWRSGTPEQALDRFGDYGPLTGATLFPIELMSVVLLGVVTVAVFRGRTSGRLAWSTALACMAGTVLLLPVYFVGANDELLSRTVEGVDVDAALASWLVWNWLRTGLAVVAVAAGCLGFRSDPLPGGARPARPRPPGVQRIPAS